MFIPFSISLSLLPLLLTSLSSSALSQSELRHRSVYQLITDRFARPDQQIVSCDVAKKEYCGGGWKGVEERLDYIRGMGFDTSACFLAKRVICFVCAFVRMLAGCAVDIG